MADSYTVEDLTALQRAISLGVRKVKYKDRETEYRSLNEMLRIEARMKKALGIDDGGGRAYLQYGRS